MAISPIGQNYTYYTGYSGSANMGDYVSHQAGDLLVVEMIENASSYTPTPSGWNLYSRFDSPMGISMLLFWKIAANGSEQMSFSGGSTNRYTSFFSFRGTDTVAPIDAHVYTSHAEAGQNVTLPSWTPSKSGTYAAGFAQAGNGNWTPPNGFTKGAYTISGLVTAVSGSLGMGATSFTWVPDAFSGLKTVAMFGVKPSNTLPTAPGTPSVSPNPVGTTATISWAASTDADGDALVYTVELSTNNGSSWSQIRSGQAGTSFVYDFTSQPETTTALLRVTASDGTAWGPSTTGSQFTISRGSYTPAMIL